ncbi:MAG: HlyD family efflux transporter periplasmic adaptor subunit, partial [Thermosynechococcaceae cyanobacterium]
IDSLPPPTFDIQPLYLDWSAATQDNVNTLPRLWVRGLLYLMVAFAAIALPWATFSQIDEVGVAQGQLEPKGKTIRLDAPVQGTVAAIHVKEGQPVQKGQPLMELQSDIVNADLQQAQVKLEGLLNRQTQLLAVKAELENSLSAIRLQIRAQGASQQATIDKAMKQQASLEDSLSLSQGLLAKDREKVAQLKDLAAQGAIPRSQADDAERVMIQNNQQQQKTQTDIEQAQAEVQKQQREYQRILQDGELNIVDKFKQVKELQSQMSDTVSEAEQTRKLIQSLKYQQRQRILYSSTSGIIFDLPIQYPGAVVQPGQLVAQIAPATSRLVLRSQMENRETGFLKLGLPAKVKFDAYPFQDYGIINGKVSWISPTSTQLSAPSSSSSGNSASINNTANKFELEIDLAKPYVEAQGRKIPLKAGQTATAEIVLRQRRVLDLFLEPFRKLSRDGLKL